MLRIHFTMDDLAKIRVATSADLGTELLMSLRVVLTGSNDVRFHQWRRVARQRRESHIALLSELCGPTALPGFLHSHVEPDHRATAASAAGVESAYRREHISHLSSVRTLTDFAGRLADEDPHARALFGRALGAYQATAIDPFWPQINALIAADCARAARIVVTGMQHLLDSLHPGIRWRSPILEVDILRTDDIEVHLNGRGLLIQPTLFGVTHPAVAGVNTPDHPPALLYPIRLHNPLGRHEPGHVRSLAPLLGRTRTAILSAIADANVHATGDLARHVDCSPASVSEHVGILRDSGLIVTTRDGQAVRHDLTYLGEALLDANR